MTVRKFNIFLGGVVGLLLIGGSTWAASQPTRSQGGMVVAQESEAAEVGAEILRQGGNAVDAAVATAFALAVTHPTAGNIGGGGFLVFRPHQGDVAAYDFREKAPEAASPDMWLKDGTYDVDRHHYSHRAVGVPGTVAGLHLAWSEQGSKPWAELVNPAIRLAEDGITVTYGLSRSFRRNMRRFQRYEASKAKFTNHDQPYMPGDTWRQPDLAKTLTRIAEQGPAGFYEGQTADLIVAEMTKNDGLITKADLKNYQAIRREPIQGKYRGFDIISMPPPSSGGVAVIEMLNILEGYDLTKLGFGSAATIHRMIESMRRAYADRAQHLGDPDFQSDMPVARLCSKEYAEQLRGTIDLAAASPSAPDKFRWPFESDETTHLSIVDKDRNAVSLTYTLEHGYGSAIVVSGGGFLLNNEMGDFNAAPGLTDVTGLIGTKPNLAEPNKRMLSSMTPTIVAKDGKLVMVTGTPGGRTIINTVLQTIVNVIDFEMNAQECVDAARIHHQWLPNRVTYEQWGLSPDTIQILSDMGHSVVEKRQQGAAQVIVVEGDILAGGTDRRADNGAAVGVSLP